jgi:hypothetical protein
MNDIRIIKTFVWHGERCFFVSTIERDSSAALGPLRYNETLVWDYDYEEKTRGTLLYQEEDMHGSMSRHLCVCAALHKDGKLTREDA